MKQIFLPNIIILFVCFLTPSSVNASHGDQIIIAGWLESVILADWQIKLRAKLDTGAKTSSIHADKAIRFEHEGKQWIRFLLPKGKRKDAIQHTIEAPVVRDVSIKRHNLPPMIRPVIELAFCINAHYYKTEFTLADRSKFNYPVLLGRSFLMNNILVDSAATFMHSNKEIKNNCKEHATKTSDEL